VLGKITLTATMTGATTTKAETVGKAVAITDARLPRINVHFNFAVSGRAPIGSQHETLLEMPMELQMPSRVKKSYC
jgi:hypothetical protein